MNQEGVYIPSDNNNGKWDWDIGKDKKKESLEWLL